MTGYLRTVAAGLAAVAGAVLLAAFPAAQPVAFASATRSLSSPARPGAALAPGSAADPAQPGPAAPSALASVSPSASASPSASGSPSPPGLPSPSPSPSATAIPVATSFSGTSAVGALFEVSKDGHLRHFCTGAVVYSPHGDLVITAAHCVQGRKLGNHGTVVFAPGYHNGHFPNGKWQVMSALMDKGWQTNQNPNDDVAFLLVGRDGHRIEKYTGAESLQTNVSLPQDVQVIGYPDSSGDPVECSGKARALSLQGYRQMFFDCGGYTGGTSGGPFLMNVNARTGLGVVIGVIGGYELGGLLPNVSYSSEFLKNVARLYAAAKKA